MKCKAILKNLVSLLISGTMLISSPMVLSCDNYSYNTCSIYDTVNSFKGLLYEARALAICVLKDFRSLSKNEKIDEKTANKLVLVCSFLIEICNNLGSSFKNIVSKLGLDVSLLNNIYAEIPINVESLYSLYDGVSKDTEPMYDYLSSDVDILVQKLSELSSLSKTISLKSHSSPEYFCSNFSCLEEIYFTVLDIRDILDEKGIVNHVDVDKILEYSDKLKVASNQYRTEDELFI